MKLKQAASIIPLPIAIDGISAAVANWLYLYPKEFLDAGLIVLNGKQYELHSYVGDQANANIKLARLFGGGGTIVVNSAQQIATQFEQALASLNTLGFSAKNVNVYISRSCISGFGWHVDPHDFLAIQISGRKEWNVNECCEPLLKNAKSINQSVMLNEGDAIVMLQGTSHFTTTPENEFSVHATFNLGDSLSNEPQIPYGKISASIK